MLKADTLTKAEIDYYRGLWCRKLQMKFSCFPVEGFRIVRDTLEFHRKSQYSVIEVLIDPIFAQKPTGEIIIKLSNSKSIPIRFIKRNQMIRISETESHQGVIAILSLPDHSDSSILTDILLKKGIIVYLDGIQDPGNTGTLIRSGVAFSAQAIIIGKNNAKPYNPKVLRATAGAFLQIPILDMGDKDPVDIIHRFKQYNFAIVGTVVSDDAIPISNFKPPEKILLVIGSEGAGIRSEIAELLDVQLTIPIFNKIDSLNAGVAGSIVLYELNKKIIEYL